MQTFQAARTVSSLNFGVFKEPRGFIKVLQFILAIFAFATATSNNTSGSFTVKACNTAVSYSGISYPYKLDKVKAIVPKECVIANNKTDVTLYPYGDWSSAGEFYVFVGVMAFLICIAVVVVYVVFDDAYQSKDFVPLIDFVMSAVFVALWLISASAFAAAVSNIKYYTNPRHLDPKEMRKSICGSSFEFCGVTSSGNYATLDVSIMFGFLNMLVWGGSLWFLWKETKWHKQRQAQGGTSGLPPSSSGGVSSEQPQI